MRRRQPFAVLVVFALVAAACTSEADPTPTTTTSTTAPPTTTTVAPSTTTGEAAADTTIGADGIGDEYYPTLGNGGYDVAHYELNLLYLPDTNLLDASVVIEATATQNLTAFNLDFEGFEISELTVGGAPAEFKRTGRELTITPPAPLRTGEPFTVEVAYAGNPGSVGSIAFPRVAMGWREGTNGERYVVAEPDAANSWFPANDHPLDKATFRYNVSVPEGWAVGSTGEFLGTEPSHQGFDTITYTWDMDEPMAPYLATVIIGEGYELVNDPVSTEVAGIPIRNFLPPDLVDDAPAALFETGEMVAALEDSFGPYPFDRYGISIVGDFPAALENQTMSIFGRLIANSPFFEFVLVHELAHQWFGNSVSVAQWKDIWLNEGFATYAELLWIEHQSGRAVYDEVVANRRQAASIANYALPGEPPPTDLFNGGVYQLGGLLLADLREEIGDDSFFNLLRRHAGENLNGNATTERFIQLAEDVSGQDLQEFFDSRLYGS